MNNAKNNKPAAKQSKDNQFDFVFGRMNYIIMGVGLVMLFFGYVLLCGGGSDDPNQFNPEMFNAQRLVVSPLLIVLGFVVEIVAIMYKAPAKKNDDNVSQE